MSHDFALWESEDPLEDDEATAIYHALVDAEPGEAVTLSPKIAAVVAALNERWPPPAPGDEDDSPWASPFDVGRTHMIVCLVPSRLWDVWPFLGDLAQQHELVMYCPQYSAVYLPRRLSRKRTRVRAKRKKQSGGDGVSGGGLTPAT